MITPNTLTFLESLAENNNREWFQSNRGEYEAAKTNFEHLCQNILEEISKFQPEMIHTDVKKCIFRINRDVRFSADKSPYKKNFAAAFGIGGKNSGKNDFYLHLQPNGETLLGGGMYMPTSQQLAMFRQEIDYNADKLKNIINDVSFRSYFSEIYGERVKRMPKGYAEDNPEIELLKYKQLFFMHRFTDSEVIQPNFAKKVAEGCQLLKPYLDYLNQLFFETNI